MTVPQYPSYALNRFASDRFSQSGEDGIIERILEVIGGLDRWCVEFGAWDGLHFSNCANLLRNRSYSGVFFEADRWRFEKLKANYKDHLRLY
jgi:hypothetical protein